MDRSVLQSSLDHPLGYRYVAAMWDRAQGLFRPGAPVLRPPNSPVCSAPGPTAHERVREGHWVPTTSCSTRRRCTWSTLLSPGRQRAAGGREPVARDVVGDDGASPSSPTTEGGARVQAFHTHCGAVHVESPHPPEPISLGLGLRDAFSVLADVDLAGEPCHVCSVLNMPCRAP